MTREELKNYLPQREPMLLVDESHREGEEVISTYKVRGDEYFLQGHFPGNPIVPGVILCEMMGQASALLIPEILDGQTLTYFAGMDKVRFKNLVHPWDTFVTKSRLTARRSNLIFIEAEGSVDGKQCCSACMTVAVMSKK